MAAWVAWESGDIEKGEKRFRESIRLLKPIGDRATLCESQRGLAELLLKRGRVEEAERFALEARETVGPLDITSRATTAGSLAMVRAAQGRDDEAEELFREGIDALADTEFGVIEYEVARAVRSVPARARPRRRGGARRGASRRALARRGEELGPDRLM